VPMAAMRRSDPIGGIECCTNTDSNCFLTHIIVDWSGWDSPGYKIPQSLFKVANQGHPLIHPYKTIARNIVVIRIMFHRLLQP
jgi:hypothetical protein